MAQLTPPPSQQNTPHRHAEANPTEAPASPTSGPSLPSSNLGNPPLTDLTASTSSGGDAPQTIEIGEGDMIDISSDSEGSSEDDEEIEERMQIEGEAELAEAEEAGGAPTEEIEGDELGETSGEPAAGGEVVAEGAEGEAVKTGGAKRKARAPRGGAKTKGKGKAPLTPGGGRATRGGGGGARGKKDGDLHESEIVSRWNYEFGDVCARPPPQKA